MANYRKELRMGTNIIKKRKIKKAIKFAERMKKVQKEARVILRKVQKKIKQQVDKGRREVEEWKKKDKVILSTKDLVFKKRPAKKLVN